MKTSSRVMYMAHLLYSHQLSAVSYQLTYNPRIEWRKALKQAWWFVHFRQQLAHGFATFSFYKKDGSIREAKGTLFMPLIPADKMPKEKEPSAISYQPSVFTFFDLDKQEWRSFSIANFIGFVSAYKLTENHFNQ